MAALAAALFAATAVVLWCTRPERAGPVHAPGPGPGDRAPSHGAVATPSTAPGGQRGADPGRGGHEALRAAAAVAVGAAVWAFTPGGTWGTAAAVGAATATWWRSRGWEPASAKRRRLRIEAELPWLVDLLTTALRAGLGPGEALARASEVSSRDVGGELQVPLARLRLGVDPVSVWSELAAHPELGRLGVTLRRATESGAPVVDALTRLAEDLRASRRTAVEVRVRRIEVRAAVPLGACLLPAFVLLAVVPLVAGSASRLLGR